MRPQVDLKPRAAHDLSEIVDYFAFEVENDALAERFVAALNESYDSLLAHPLIGSPRWQWLSKKLVDVRSWPVPGFPSYLVFYRPSRTGIEVLRILHGARDLIRILM